MNKNPTGHYSWPRERRAKVRHNLYLPISLSGRNSEGHQVWESTVTVNISPIGAFFLSQNEFTPDTVLDIHFDPLVEGDTGHNLRARVVRIDRSIRESERDPRYGIGVSFQGGVDSLLS